MFDKRHDLRFLLVSHLFFLICAQKNQTTAHMCGDIKTLKHNLRTTLRLACHGHNISHTRAKRVK